MPALEITATFLKEFWRSGDSDFFLGKAWLNGDEQREIVIAGEAERGELVQEQDYLFSGEFKTHPQHGERFAFNAFAFKQPHSREAVIYYLANAGEGANANFGRMRATKCWELFGGEAVAKLREYPADVAAILTECGGRFALKAEQAAAVAEILRRDVALESATIELTGLLANRRFRRTLPKQLLRDFGAAAASKVRENPFILLPYAGCGFKLCDAMWLSLGLPAGSLTRQAVCAWHVVNSDKEGSTWVYRGVVEEGIRALIGATDLRIDEAIQLAIDEGMLVECQTAGAGGPLSTSGNVRWLAKKEESNREDVLARLVADAMEEPHFWPDVSTIPNIDGEQPEVLTLALRGSVAILRGRPGTGKTFTAANLIKYLLGVLGTGTVGIAAPTNLAAQRLNQAMADYGVEVKARTNHSLLGRPEAHGHEWRHDEFNPLPFKVLVIDEASMLDLRILYSIFRARSKGTMVLLIGDTNQLPPVDRGCPLRDLIAAGVPSGELTQIRRNSGGIVEACAAIAEGRAWGVGDNLEIVQVDDEESQKQALLQKLEECSLAGFDPVWDSRVLVPKNDSRRAVNKLLQGVLNPKNPPIDGVAFRVNDKVICRDSQEFKIVSVDQSSDEVEYGDFQQGKKPTVVKIANGELGRVLEIGNDKGSYMHVQVEAPRRVVRVPLGKLASQEIDEGSDPGDDKQDKTGTGCCWDLAYAVTFHSSQGSEFAWPILMASSRDANMGYRELPYTGISRGKHRVVLIGKKAVWDKFCRRVQLAKRKTFLRERILLEQAKRQLAEL